MNEIKIIEPKLKIWASRERTVQIAEYQPEKIHVGISEAIDEELTAEQKKSRLRDLADMVENELNARVERLTGEKKSPSTPSKTPSNPPDETEEEAEIPTIKCSKCGQILEGKPDKFKEGEFYFWCGKCRKYERD